MMGKKQRCAWILLGLAGLALALVPVVIAADSDPTVAAATSTGTLGVSASIGSLMQRQAALGEERELERDQEEEIEQPDRSHLPQNPASPAASQFPGFVPEKSNPAGDRIQSPQTVGTSFTGATLSGVNPTLSFPPDCMGAVGPTQYVVFVNGRLVTFNKATGVADGVLNADPDVFFSSVRNGSRTSDPRIRYDRLTARWFLAIINVSTPNRILIAVSDAASNGVITAGTVFTFFYIPIATTPPTISSTCLADYPTLGLDANALYLGTNNFCGTPQSFNSTDGYVVRKSSILGAGPMVVTVFRGMVATSSSAGPYTPQGVDNYDPAASEGYFIGVDNVSYGLLMMRRISNPGGTPTISSNLSISVAATGAPMRVPHLGNTGGTSGQLSALDDRLFAAHIRNGHLWTAHNIGVNNTGVSSGTLTRNASRWYDLNVPTGSGTPTVNQYGTVYTASASNTTDQRHYWIPSIMVSGQGHAALGLCTAGTNERANAGTVGRLASDALGTMETPVVFTSSSTAYNPSSDPGGSNGRRWGDYTYTSLDPLDDQTMWTVTMFCDATNSYGVRVAKLIAPPPATPSSLPDVTAGQNPVTVTLTGVSASGSGFFDPGANLPGVPAFSHLAASVTNGSATGTPPAVVSATYVNPTTVTLVLDATLATANLPGQSYTVTVTNPDGQSASAAVLHVVGGAPVATLAAGPALAEGNAGTTDFAFTVNLSSAATSPVTVNYQTSDGTATVADGDYQAATSSITIPASGTSGLIHITVNGDTKYEAQETFTVTLTAATNATLGAPVTATGTLENDDAVPTVAIDSITLAEGNAGTTAFGFTVSLSQPSGVAAAVDFTTTDGTATLADLDYQALSGTVNFAPGTTSQPVTVLVNGDTTVEGDETFTVDLSNPVGAAASTMQGMGTIQNDDSVPLLSIAGVTALEGNGGTTPFVFTVGVANPGDQPVSVQYQTADGTAAQASGDYQAASGTLNIPAHTASGEITVLVNGDTCGEAAETFSVTLSAPTGAAIDTGTATGTIQNDDDATAPEVAVTAPNGGEHLMVGATTSITWNASDNVGVTGVDILLSRDGGNSYPEALATGIANNGSFDWQVNGPTPVSSAFVRVVAHDGGCNSNPDASDASFMISDPLTAVEDRGPVTEFALGRIFPNPTSGAVEIEFQLPSESPVRLTVVDVKGRKIATVIDRRMPAGRHSASWSGQTENGPAVQGVYFVRYEAGGKRFAERLVLTR
jgi:hypothetical protein